MLDTPSPRRVLRLKEVLAMRGISRAKLYDDVAFGRFPPPIKDGKINLWLADEVAAFQADLIAKRDARAAEIATRIGESKAATAARRRRARLRRLGRAAEAT